MEVLAPTPISQLPSIVWDIPYGADASEPPSTPAASAALGHWSKSQQQPRDRDVTTTTVRTTTTPSCSSSTSLPNNLRASAVRPSTSDRTLRGRAINDKEGLGACGPGIKAPASSLRVSPPSVVSSTLQASQSLVTFPVASSVCSSSCTETMAEDGHDPGPSRSSAPRPRQPEAPSSSSTRRNQVQARRFRRAVRSKSLDESTLELFKPTACPLQTTAYSGDSTPSPSNERFPQGITVQVEPGPPGPPHRRSPPQHPKRKIGRRMSSINALTRTWHTLMELLDTERGYLNDLKSLISVYEDTLGRSFDLSTEEADKVSRNSQELLLLHERLHEDFCRIEAMVSISTPHSSKRELPSDPFKAEAALARAVDATARLFLINSRSFDIYQNFCAGHTEAIDIVRRLQNARPIDWDVFERCCAIASTTTSQPSPPFATPLPRRRHDTSDGQLFIDIPHLTDAWGIGNARPSRLSCMDFLIKPVQRICRYPLLLGQLKEAVARTGTGLRTNFDPDLDPEGMLDLALGVMKGVVGGVDEAKKAREIKIKTRLIAERMEGHPLLTPSILVSLGECLMAGSLHIIHHHVVLAPLRPPVKARYFGAFLYNGYMIFAKIRRGKIYEPRHYFSLATAEVNDTTAEPVSATALMPYSFRLSVGLHTFELGATCVGEKDLWLRSIKTARAKPSLPKDVGALTNLQTVSAEDIKGQIQGSENMIKFLVEPFSMPRLESAGDMDARPRVLVSHARSNTVAIGEGGQPSPTANATTSRRTSFFGATSSTTPISPSGLLVRRESVSQSLLVDRNLTDVFSVPCLTVRPPILQGPVNTQSPTTDLPISSTANGGRTQSLSHPTNKVPNRNSSVGSIFHRRSTAGVYSGPSDSIKMSDMPPPPNPTKASPVRRRTLLNSITLLAASSNNDPSIVVEAEDEGVNLRTPDSGTGVSPTSPNYVYSPVTPDGTSSDDHRQRLDKAQAQSHIRSNSVSQSFLEFFSRHSSSTSSMARRDSSSSTASQGPPTGPPPPLTAIAQPQRAAPPVPENRTSFVQRSLTYVKRKRALSTPGISRDFLPPVVKSTDGPTTIQPPYLLPQGSLASSSADTVVPRRLTRERPSHQSLRPRSSTISLRAILASEPRKATSTVEATDRVRVKSAPIESLFAPSQLPPAGPDTTSSLKRKLTHKTSRNFIKRALFQVV